MSTYDLLPPSWRGMLDFLRYHPFWHPKYREDFGKAIIVLSIFCQLALFGILLVKTGRDFWPLLLILAFVGGSLAALVLCSEFAIVVRHFRGQQGLGALLLFQGIGSALVVGALVFARPPGSLASVANGIALYPFFIGLVVIGAAPLAIWEGTRK